MQVTKILTVYLVGANKYGNEGKSAFLERHATGQFNIDPLRQKKRNYTLYFNTNYGKIQIDVKIFPYDYTATAGTIVMCDLSSRETIEPYRVTSDTPIVFVGNKSDLASPKEQHRSMLKLMNATHPSEESPFYAVSTRSCYNFEKPFLHLMKINIARDLHFGDAPPIVLPPSLPKEVGQPAHNPYFNHVVLNVKKNAGANLIVNFGEAKLEDRETNHNNVIVNIKKGYETGLTINLTD